MLQLRPYQRAALDALDGHWRGGGGNGLIVLPTGAGKALVIAALVRETMRRAPAARIAIVTHVRELVVQNHRELMGYWPEAPAGIFSAGVGRRDAAAAILFCGIQSVRDRADALAPFDLVIVDEAHLIPRSADTGYGRFLTAARARNPGLRIVGLTATPYRLDSGRLDEGAAKIFERIVYEANVGDLIHQGWLAPLISKATLTALDVTGVPRRGGDYIPAELEAAVNRDWITRAAVEEMAGYGRDRRAWLAFCAGLAHAAAVRDAVRAEGFSCETISGDTPRRERDGIIAAFRARKIRCLTSVGVLSTGFNVPEVDLIALLRPTQSAGLYVQQVGRALRRAPGKTDALILDYAGLVRTHGPVDVVTARSVALALKAPGETRAKACPRCGALIALNATTCEGCWVEPEDEDEAARHEAAADDELTILSAGVAGWRQVEAWRLGRHTGPGGSDRLEAEFRCPVGSHRVQLALEQSGYEREKAVRWWRGLGGTCPAPMTAAEAMERRHELIRPVAIQIRADGRLSESIACRFADGRVFSDVRRRDDQAA